MEEANSNDRFVFYQEEFVIAVYCAVVAIWPNPTLVLFPNPILCGNMMFVTNDKSKAKNFMPL